MVFSEKLNFKRLEISLNKSCVYFLPSIWCLSSQRTFEGTNSSTKYLVTAQINLLRICSQEHFKISLNKKSLAFAGSSSDEKLVNWLHFTLEHVKLLTEKCFHCKRFHATETTLLLYCWEPLVMATPDHHSAPSGSRYMGRGVERAAQWASLKEKVIKLRFTWIYGHLWWPFFWPFGYGKL